MTQYKIILIVNFFTSKKSDHIVVTILSRKAQRGILKKMRAGASNYKMTIIEAVKKLKNPTLLNSHFNSTLKTFFINARICYRRTRNYKKQLKKTRTKKEERIDNLLKKRTIDQRLQITQKKH